MMPHAMPGAMRPAYAASTADGDAGCNASQRCTDGRTDGLTENPLQVDVNLELPDARERAGNQPSTDKDTARFWSKVDNSAGPDRCWPYGGTVLGNGYGQIKAHGKRWLAHRFAWTITNGPIPDGLTIDHVRARGCTRRDCVNPAHLEPVTMAENLRRSTACSTLNALKTCCPKCGGEYRRSPDGKRFCSPCKTEWKRRRRHAA